MNIFILDRNPRIAAQLMCDEHLNKMILEGAQMLSTVANKLLAKESSMLYASTHENHPCVRWLQESGANCNWLAIHLSALENERQYRFGEREPHKALKKADYAMEVIGNLAPDCGLTPFVRVTPSIAVEAGLGTVQLYQRYYQWKDTNQFSMHWTKRDRPLFMNRNYQEYTKRDHSQSME